MQGRKKKRNKKNVTWAEQWAWSINRKPKETGSSQNVRETRKENKNPTLESWAAIYMLCEEGTLETLGALSAKDWEVRSAFSLCLRVQPWQPLGPWKTCRLTNSSRPTPLTSSVLARFDSVLTDFICFFSYQCLKFHLFFVVYVALCFVMSWICVYI